MDKMAIYRHSFFLPKKIALVYYKVRIKTANLEFKSEKNVFNIIQLSIYLLFFIHS